MALLLRPANLGKNVAETVTISYAELAALSAVPTGFYKNTSNWKEVSVLVKHKASGQKSIIQFTPPSTTGTLLVSDAARSGSWEIDSFIIRDFDRGEVVITKANIPDQNTLDFNVISPASHGDLIVSSGQTVTIPANGFRQYGDLVVESGGTLQLEDGGGILEIEVLSNCVINGTILAKQGKHTGGTWNTISKLGENLSFASIQNAGGNGGAGEEYFTYPVTSLIDSQAWTLNGSPYVGDGNFYFGYTTQQVVAQIFTGLKVGETYNISATLSGKDPADQPVRMRVDGGALLYFSMANGANNTSFVATATTHQFDFYVGAYTIASFQQTVSNLSISGPKAFLNVAGIGGLAAFGNGGGGGRSAAFIALAGNDAMNIQGGAGAGSVSFADTYGQAGPNSSSTANAAGGGFRGAHGQAIYIKANKIQGSGSILASGQAGGNGGAGAEYLSGGQLYSNGAGGGAAGGSGGNVWLRAKKGTPALTIDVIGGERGTRGLSYQGSVDAGHGSNGNNGSYNFSLF